MNKKILALFLLCLFPLASATTIINIQTIPLKDVWITATTSTDEALKFPEMYVADSCGRLEVNYEINESTFYLLIKIKDQGATLFIKEYSQKFYKDTKINLTALPEDYTLNLDEKCFKENTGEEFIPLEDNSQETENVSNITGYLENESLVELTKIQEKEISKKGNFLITGYSFFKENAFKKENLLYFIVIILIAIILFLIIKNNKKSSREDRDFSNRLVFKENSGKIERLKKRIVKYEDKILKLRQKDLDPKKREKFYDSGIHAKDLENN